MRLAIALITFAALATAQEAKVMILERGDTYDLQQAYKQYRDALKHWDEVKVKVAAHYTVEGSGKDAKTIPGWEKVQFSPDFRAIVPESSPYAGSRVCYSQWGTGLVYTPANGVVHLSGQTGTASATTADLGGGGSGIIQPPFYASSSTEEPGIASDLIVKEK